MSPGVLIGLFFLVALGICMSGLYFFVAQPLARRNLKLRLTTPPAVLDEEEDADDTQIVRAKSIINIPALSALVPKLEFFLQQAAIKTPVSKFLSIAAAASAVSALITLVFGFALVFVLLAAIVGGAAPF